MPEHAQYASPIVVIFSTPIDSSRRSNSRYITFSIRTTSMARCFDDHAVNPAMSLKRTVAAHRSLISSPAARRRTIDGATIASSMRLTESRVRSVNRN